MREIRAYGSVGAPEGNLRRYPAGPRRDYAGNRERGGLVSLTACLLATIELHTCRSCQSYASGTG